MKFNFFGFSIDYLTIFGLSAQFLFFLRFIYQWFISEKKKESIIPIEFWYFSIIGGILITVYAFLRRDLVFFLGQILALFIYSRNLCLIKSKLSNNYQKYQTINPIKKYLINYWLKKISNIINKLRVENILDVGCGEGYVISFLKKKNPRLKFLGVDISKKALVIAAKQNQKEKFILGDVKKIDKIVSGKTYDLALVLEVLEHLKEPTSAIKKLKLIKTKHYLFSVPKEPFFSLANLLTGKNIFRLGKNIDHHSFWSKREFISLLKNHFHVIKVINHPFWTVVLTEKNSHV